MLLRKVSRPYRRRQAANRRSRSRHPVNRQRRMVHDTDGTRIAHQMTTTDIDALRLTAIQAKAGNRRRSGVAPIAQSHDEIRNPTPGRHRPRSFGRGGCGNNAQRVVHPRHPHSHGGAMGHVALHSAGRVTTMTIRLPQVERAAVHGKTPADQIARIRGQGHKSRRQ